MDIQDGVSLSDKNWFRTGGLAKYYCEPGSVENWEEAIQFAKKNGLEIFLLGEGANILVSDDGFDGLVIHPKKSEPEINFDQNAKEYFIEADAGVSIQELIDFCLDNNFIGLEDFSGIPGTVGGSVYINIHYFDFLLSDFLVSATVINKNTLETEWVDAQWFNFGYDKSKLFEGEYYLIDATFKVEQVDEIKASYAKGRRDEIIKHRERRYPTSGTCGSFFRNFKEEDSDFSKLPEIGGRKMVFVAYYIDKAGLKGELKVGDAIVSTKHSNMIENIGDATSEDIINLAKEMQSVVKEKFGVSIKNECQLIGFRSNPFIN